MEGGGENYVPFSLSCCFLWAWIAMDPATSATMVSPWKPTRARSQYCMSFELPARILTEAIRRAPVVARQPD